jgi:LAO/AO transport system kinase
MNAPRISRPALDRWALSRALTRLANADPAALDAGPGITPEIAPDITPDITPDTALGQPALRIGITGAPGAGKSTLIGCLAQLRGADGRRLGVLAVDPSSPRTGGAILGDRVRMDALQDMDQVYIRSLGSRRTNDGLADNLPEMLDLMDAFGFDEVILETVGVGQAEHAVRAQVDTLVLVLLPDSGDSVQAMKAGIMEMADIFVVHKADLPGAQRMVADLRRIAALQRLPAQAWAPPILLTSSADAASVQGLSDAVDRHRQWRREHASADVAVERARYRLRRLAERRLARFLSECGPAFFEQTQDAQWAALLSAMTCKYFTNQGDNDEHQA